MRKRTALIARLKKLEQRQARKGWKRRIIFAIGDGVPDSAVTGLTDSSSKVHFMRWAGEPLSAFERRTAETLPRLAIRCYSAPCSEPEAESWPEPELGPSAA